MLIEEYFDFSHPDEIRLAGHRINIETILVEYLDGMVPEEIAALAIDAGRVQALFSSHPPLEKRVAALEQGNQDA